MKKNEMLRLALNFVKAIEHGQQGEELNKYYHDGVEQIEFPNQLTQQIAIRDLAALKAASIKGKQVISKQIYEVIKTHITPDAVILELFWTGELAMPLGKLKAGEEMKAHFAQFFEFKDGKIFRQRNYDCFIPF